MKSCHGFRPETRCTTKGSITLSSAVVICICLNALGNAGTEQANWLSGECSWSQSKLGSAQTVVTGKLLGYPDTPIRAILFQDGMIHQIGQEQEIRAIAPNNRFLEYPNVLVSLGFVNAHEHSPYSSSIPGPNVVPA